MAALNYRVLNSEGREVDTIALDPAVFAASVNENLVHQTVRWQLAKRRAGTHSTMTRAEMSGGGRKPWKQKGRGTARSGSNTSPIWVGGGVAHGPKPRDYTFRLPKRTRRQALCAVLSDKVLREDLVVVDDLAVQSGRTADMASVLAKLCPQLKGKGRRGAALVTEELDQSVRRSSRNLSGVIALPVAGVNVFDLVNARYLVITRTAVEALVRRLKVDECSTVSKEAA